MYLGLDLGTSGVKALLIDDAQRVVGSAHAALEVSRPLPGWSEQPPSDWIRATEQALDALAAQHGRELSAVRGIGLSGQMHGATLLDAGDVPLRPCILWNDTRAAEEAAALDTDPRFRSITGNIVFPGFTAPKLVWTRTHEPTLFGKVRKVLLPKDYLRLWLTGEHVSDVSDSAGTSWLDTGARAWSDTLLAATGMSVEQMPRLIEGTEVSGTLRPQLASRWGMGPSTFVAGGGGDNAVSAVGTGTIKSGSAFVSLGTSGVVFAANDRYMPAPDSAIHAFCHALPNTWHQMGVILSAASALDWHASVTHATPAQLMLELEATHPEGKSPTRPATVTFLPYLSGERTPHNDARIRGAFLGLDHATTRSDMTRAVLEGVGYALRDNLEALGAAGTRLERIVAVGGGTRAPAWISTLANTLGIPVDVPEGGETGAAFGAARLGLIAAEAADPEQVCTPPRIAATCEPCASSRDAWETGFERFRSLYPALRQID